MKTLPDDSIDAIICDPPYNLAFMGKTWDTHINNAAYQEWTREWATEAYRVLKPGGHLLAFGGTRTYHRQTCGIEDAGFEIRDCLAWIYGTGFPKSLNVSKAIDKRPGVTRHAEFAAHLRERIAVKGYTNTFDVAEAVIGRRTGAVANWQKYQWPEAKWWPALRDLLDLDESWGDVIAEAKREKTGEREVAKLAFAPGQGSDHSARTLDVSSAATREAQQWEGWGTALKPAMEPIVVARKPLSEGTVAANVLEHGTGALNIDASRIGSDTTRGERYGGKPPGGSNTERAIPGQRDKVWSAPAGRWPANILFDEEAAAVLDEQSGERKAGGKVKGHEPSRTGQNGIYGTWGRVENAPHNDAGGASRFFYVAKAGKKERNAGLDDFDEQRMEHSARITPQDNPRQRSMSYNKNTHPCVKPIQLLRYLSKLVTPPGGTILDPFMGSGSGGCAAVLEGFNYIGIEMEPEYLEIARARIEHWSAEAT